MKYLIYNPFTKNHDILINNLILNLSENKYNYEIINEIGINENENDTYIIFINHMFLIKNKKAIKDYQKLLGKKNKILYITEPIELLIEIKYYKKIINELKPKKVLTYCYENLKKINTLCIFKFFYTINHKYLKFNSLNTNFLKNKDLNKIVFIGKLNEYRRGIIKEFKEDIIIFEDKFEKEDWIEIINKYQYFLNIHRRPNSRCFESMRIIPLLYNYCTVISENVNIEEEELYNNKNIYFCNYKEFKNKFEEIKKIKEDNIIQNRNNINFNKFDKVDEL